MAKILETQEWVRLAASKDRTGPRVLTGMDVRGGKLAATDRWRLHITEAASGLDNGVYSVDGSLIDERFPNYEVVVPLKDGSAAFVVNMALGVREGEELIAALVAFDKLYAKSSNARWLVKVGTTYLRPAFVADALRGMVGGMAAIWTQGPLKPILVTDNAGRTAVIMPCKFGDPGALDLASFDSIVTDLAAQQVAS